MLRHVYVYKCYILLYGSGSCGLKIYNIAVSSQLNKQYLFNSPRDSQ